ncbi:hypothetical protein C8A00DRAFT_28495 [Chaetomidium leptoderma]|uniref:Uncharacterized protein n=1 Tax=Chaetomidium leptoderma TaxID=669021 RepID=A0AAN6VX89_9PEZI|nr:hypothetical protein C8A00DRAFT_28495 [Chaetomidium leptoderma]
MLINRPHPPSILHATTKPQLHTLKNHDTYSGVRDLPLATHVRVDRRNTSVRYIITLSYAHNRACSLSRSPDDVRLLTQNMAAATRRPPQPPPPPPPPPVQGPPPTSPSPCSRVCSCPCPCSVRGADAQSAADLNQLLEAELEKGRKWGGAAVGVSVKFFLRRRMEDCAGDC